MQDNNAYLDLDAALGDEYFINRELPQGAGFSVFAGTSKHDGSHVEIKTVPLEVFGVERAPSEAELSRRRIQHPNIVPVQAAGSYAGAFYWISPSIEGRTLRMRLSRGGRIETGDALTILRDASAGLTHAHLHGIVHGGLTPDSILISGGSALVSDIGIPEVFAGLRGARAVEKRMATPIGSEPLRYAAPEQMKNGRSDARSDVYAWGVIAYELLGGRHPFASRATPREVMAAHTMEEAAPLVIPGSDPPANVSRLVMRCLAKNPADRPETAREILDVMTKSMLIPPPAPPAGRGQKIIIGLAILLLIVLAMAIWTGMSG
jgi:serine/threonine-protein kinase